MTNPRQVLFMSVLDGARWVRTPVLNEVALFAHGKSARPFAQWFLNQKNNTLMFAYQKALREELKRAKGLQEVTR